MTSLAEAWASADNRCATCYQDSVSLRWSFMSAMVASYGRLIYKPVLGQMVGGTAQQSVDAVERVARAATVPRGLLLYPPPLSGCRASHPARAGSLRPDTTSSSRV